MGNKPRFPMYIDISQKNIVVIGGGNIAKRRIEKMTPFCEQLTIVSPDLMPELQQFCVYNEKTANACRILWKCKAFSEEDIEDADIVLICTNDNELNESIYDLCQKKHILVNACENRDHCDFHFPSIVMEQDMVIAISSGGNHIKKVKKTRQDIEAMFADKNKKRIIVGSRESILAVAQSNMVIDYLQKKHPEIETELLTMKTKGDKILDRRLDQIGGKGLFVKELDQALLEKRSDISVHSLKDMPADISEELPLVAFSKREDPRDVLVLPKGASGIDFAKPIGTSSMRRILQLKELYPEATFASVRGNLQTRLRKLDEGQYSALILAAAGLKRLGLENRISRYFSIDEVIPSAGQAIIVVQGRANENYDCLAAFNDVQSEIAAKAERRFIYELDAGCTSPIAVHTVFDHDHMTLKAFYYDEEKNKTLKDEISGSIDQYEELAVALADRFRK